MCWKNQAALQRDAIRLKSKGDSVKSHTQKKEKKSALPSFSTIKFKTSHMRCLLVNRQEFTTLKGLKNSEFIFAILL